MKRTDTPQVEEGRSGFTLAVSSPASSSEVPTSSGAGSRIETTTERLNNQNQSGYAPPVGALPSLPDTPSADIAERMPSNRHGRYYSSNHSLQETADMNTSPHCQDREQRPVIHSASTYMVVDGKQQSTHVSLDSHHFEPSDDVAHFYDVDDKLDTGLSSEECMSTLSVRPRKHKSYGTGECLEERHIFTTLKNATLLSRVPDSRKIVKVHSHDDLIVPTIPPRSILRLSSGQSTKLKALSSDSILDEDSDAITPTSRRVGYERPRPPLPHPWIRQSSGSYWSESGLDDDENDGSQPRPANKKHQDEDASQKTGQRKEDLRKHSSRQTVESVAKIEGLHKYPRRMRRYSKVKLGDGAVIGPTEYLKDEEEVKVNSAPESKTSSKELLEEMEKMRDSLILKRKEMTDSKAQSQSKLTNEKTAKANDNMSSPNSPLTWPQTAVLVLLFSICTVTFVSNASSHTTGHGFRSTPPDITNTTLTPLDDTGRATFAPTSPSSGTMQLSPIYHLSLSASQKEDICVRGMETHWELQHDVLIEGLENLGPQGPMFRAIEVPDYGDLFVFIVMVVGLYHFLVWALKCLLTVPEGRSRIHEAETGSRWHRPGSVMKLLWDRKNLFSILLGMVSTAALVSGSVWAALKTDG